MNTDRFGYTLETVRYRDYTQRVGKFVCVECGNSLKINYGGRSAPPPEFFVKKAKNDGWAVDPRKKTHCYCSQCLLPRAAEKELKVVEPVPIKPEDREPTSAQRRAIREELALNFDEDRGEYKGGMTDRKIGEKLKMPSVWVTRVREHAYGPILVDPIVAEIEKKMKELTDYVFGQIELPEKKIAELRKRQAA